MKKEYAVYALVVVAALLIAALIVFLIFQKQPEGFEDYTKKLKNLKSFRSDATLEFGMKNGGLSFTLPLNIVYDRDGKRAKIESNFMGNKALSFIFWEIKNDEISSMAHYFCGKSFEEWECSKTDFNFSKFREEDTLTKEEIEDLNKKLGKYMKERFVGYEKIAGRDAVCFNLTLDLKGILTEYLKAYKEKLGEEENTLIINNIEKQIKELSKLNFSEIEVPICLDKETGYCLRASFSYSFSTKLFGEPKRYELYFKYLAKSFKPNAKISDDEFKLPGPVFEYAYMNFKDHKIEVETDEDIREGKLILEKHKEVIFQEDIKNCKITSEEQLFGRRKYVIDCPTLKTKDLEDRCYTIKIAIKDVVLRGYDCKWKRRRTKYMAASFEDHKIVVKGIDEEIANGNITIRRGFEKIFEENLKNCNITVENETSLLYKRRYIIDCSALDIEELDGCYTIEIKTENNTFRGIECV